MPRYVVLYHDFPEGHARAPHWDLMLEWGTTLKSWALAGSLSDGAIVDAEQLADHRAMYLDYEGPISGDRGSVSRWDTGRYRLDRSEENEIRAQLAGARLRGMLTLSRSEPGHSWRVGFCAEPTTF